MNFTLEPFLILSTRRRLASVQIDNLTENFSPKRLFLSPRMPDLFTILIHTEHYQGHLRMLLT